MLVTYLVALPPLLSEMVPMIVLEVRINWPIVHTSQLQLVAALEVLEWFVKVRTEDISIQSLKLSKLANLFLLTDKATTPYANCTDGELQLVGGANATLGVVQVCMNNAWGSVCNGGFGVSDAKWCADNLASPPLEQWPSETLLYLELSQDLCFWTN